MNRIEKVLQNDDSAYIYFIKLIKTFIVFISFYLFSILEKNSIYELTNYALFKKWTFHMVLMDSIWGGILCTIVSSMYILFISFTNKYFNIM